MILENGPTGRRFLRKRSAECTVQPGKALWVTESIVAPRRTSRLRLRSGLVAYMLTAAQPPAQTQAQHAVLEGWRTSECAHEGACLAQEMLAIPPERAWEQCFSPSKARASFRKIESVSSISARALAYAASRAWARRRRSSHLCSMRPGRSGRGG